MYVHLWVKNAKNFASQAKTSSGSNFTSHFLNKSEAFGTGHWKDYLLPCWRNQKNACMSEVCSALIKSYKVQDFVLIPEKRRCSYFRIMQLQTVNGIILRISLFAYKLFICCVIVNSLHAMNCEFAQLSWLTRLYSVLDDLGKIEKTGLAMFVKWRNESAYFCQLKTCLFENLHQLISKLKLFVAS